MKQAQKENSEQSIKHDKEIKEDLKILKDMVHIFVVVKKLIILE